MITYTTKFPVNDALTKEAFVRMVIRWNQGSTHDKIDGVEWDGETYNQKWEQESRSLEIQAVETDGVLASRLKKEDEHGIWTTDFVLNTEKRSLAVSVALVTTEFTTDFEPTFYPPYFVKLIIYKEYAGEDNGLQVAQKAHEVTACKALMNKIGSKGISMKLPVVYLTKTHGEGIEVDVDDLAFKLQGVAHVVYEPDGYEEKLEYESLAGQNYSGKAIIFFPSSRKQAEIFSYSGVDLSAEQFENQIIHSVYRYMIQRIRVDIDTWDGVLSEKLHLRNRELLASKESVEEENNSLYEEFGDQLTKMEETNGRLNNEVQRLTAEVQGLRMKFSDRTQTPVLFSGKEKDFYEGEIREIILEILEEYRRNCQEGTRRHDVIDDILQCNEFLHLPEKRRDTLKKALKGYRTLSGSLKSDLEAMGIRITSDGKHYKWTYYGDSRYFVTVAKTSSDARAGMNMAATMEKLML